MRILEGILLELKEEELDIQVFEICNRIQEEEDPPNETLAPKNTSIFLCLEYNNSNENEIKFLTLEREIPNKYFIGFWCSKNDKQVKRIKSIDINERKAEEILKAFAKTYKSEKENINE